MASIIVRDIDPAVKERFRARAQRHGRSMEAEARALIPASVATDNPGLALIAAFQAVGGWEMPVLPGHDDRNWSDHNPTHAPPPS